MALQDLTLAYYLAEVATDMIRHAEVPPAFVGPAVVDEQAKVHSVRLI